MADRLSVLPVEATRTGLAPILAAHPPNRKTANERNTMTDIYAMLVTNDETTPLEIDPTRPLSGQVEEPIATAAEKEIGDLLVPPFRNCEVYTAPRWRAEDIVGTIFCLEWGLSIDGLLVNLPAWYCYGRSPIVGPAVLAVDCNPDGTLNPIPSVMAVDLQEPLPDDIRLQMAEIAGNVDYAEYRGRWPK